MTQDKTDKLSQDESLFPEAIRLMRLRHKFETAMQCYGINDRQEIEEIKEELLKIEMLLYKITNRTV